MIKVEKIAVEDLKLGMFVSQLDRPWVETSFPLQGLILRVQADIDAMVRQCRYVYIDIEKSIDYQFSPHATSAGKPQPTAQKVSSPRLKGSLGQFERVNYNITQPLRKEVAKATMFHSEVVRSVLRLLQDVRADKPLNVRVARKAAGVMVHSIIRNPDAMVWLARLKDRDSYSYQHGIRSAILATVLGRSMGLPQPILENLATGTLLMDVGMADVPRHITHATAPLSDTEKATLKQHVACSMQRLTACEGLDEQILALVQYHHERHDGSGYPFNLKGNQIPVLARIAGLVDHYDMLTSPRLDVDAISSSKAVALLYEQRDQAFHGKLVEQFIQTIGVYPTGTLVELNTGQVGAVVAQNASRRLRPQVMLVLNQDKQPAEPNIVDLLKVRETALGEPLSIARALEAESFGVDIGRLNINAA